MAIIVDPRLKGNEFYFTHQPAERVMDQINATKVRAFTPRMEKAIVIASEIAQELGHDYIGTEHIVLAIFRMPDNTAGKHMLIVCGAVEEKAREVYYPKSEKQENFRPEWVHCVQHNQMIQGRTWCGRTTAMKWLFQDIDHAAYTGLRGERIVACPECVAAITKALQNGHDDLEP